MPDDLSTLSVPLPGGRPIPLLGFGTWQLSGEEAYRATRDAIEVGYRHVDTATGYGNEDRIGAAIADSGVDRDQLFVTTKCPPENVGRELATLEDSLRALRLEQVDLWLVHWPPGGEARPATWERFVQAQADGRARAIGVSNYSPAQIDELLEATGTAPALDQIPWAPSMYDPDLVGALEERRVILEGYSPLTRSDLAAPVLGEVADAHGVTVAQVVLRWHVQHRFVVIPKSARRERIEENFELGFELAPEEMDKIDALGR
jgi:2,5-diketo-D-gluconate reductase A